MKNLLTFVTIIISGLSLTAQNRLAISEHHKNRAEKIPYVSGDIENFGNNYFVNNFQQPKSVIMGHTYYDLQSNCGIHNRFHVFDDGTMAVVYNYGTSFPAFPERGTGYNYFDGNTWGPFPTQRVESVRTGFPSYAPFGVSGEIFCSHLAGAAMAGLLFEKRETKGQGDWSELHFQGPLNFEDVMYPRIATAGQDNNTIHLICLTNMNQPYQGIQGAILYSRSTDGGLTWQPENALIPEINNNYYHSFYPDTYEIIAKDDLVAILYGSRWQDLGLLKSSDGGNNFTKTIIWEHPYPFLVPGTPTDTFYCVDGAHHLAFDSDGMVHVVFGINRSYSDLTGSYWFPLVDGLGYWNENRPGFSNALNALSPYGDPGSELMEDYSLIGWSQDVNNNGEWDILGEPGWYFLGISSQPQIIVNEQDEILVIYSSVTETYNNGLQDYRHIWARYSLNGEFWGSFDHLTYGNQFASKELVFPAVSDNFESSPVGLMFHYICQMDDEPGMAVMGDGDAFSNNLILFPDLIVNIEKNNFNDRVTKGLQIYPNPSSSCITLTIDQGKPVEQVIIYNHLLQKVHTEKPANSKVDVTMLRSGLYWLEAISAENKYWSKLIVK